jgi:ATP/maltotriose-dependent transcriptional regulator MalT
MPNLIVTKIVIPKRSDDLLRRARLLEFLHEYLDRKLLLVSAAAGYGKTALLTDLASDTEIPVCWYSLDNGDRDPQVFLEYLVASIRRQFPRFGARTSALLQDPAQARNHDTVVGTLVTEIYEDIPQYFVLVLDDYHLVDASAPVNHILDSLLNYLPDNAHIILASRTLPTELNLTRLTARQQVAGMGVNELRFHADEIRALMQQNYHLEITQTVAEQLADQSEGWIAGLVLTTPTLWRGLFEDWVKARGPSSQLFEFLATEVLAQQPASLQTFLLESSILDEMSVRLLNELLGIANAHTQFDAIEARNLFTTRLDGDWYRYHHLFREFLATRLERTNIRRFQALQRRAAELFEQRGELNIAVEHWLKSGDFENAARVIELAAESLHNQGRGSTLAGWIDQLPAPLLEKKPALLVRRGSIHIEAGELHQAQAVFAQARHVYELQHDTLSLARVLIQEAIVARFQGQNDECIAKCRSVLELVDSREFGVLAATRRTMGTALLAQGNFPSALTELEYALRLYHLTNDRYNATLTEHDLGITFRGLGDHARADEHFQQALNGWRQLKNTADLANTLNSIAVGHYHQGELAQAQALFEEALSEVKRAGYLRFEAYITTGQGDVFRDQGEFERALEAYSAAFSIAEKIQEGLLITYALAAMSDVWRLTGDLSAAEQVAHSAMDSAQSHRSDYESALAQTALGAVRLYQGARNEAINDFQHALNLFERGHAKRDAARVRYFLAQAYFNENKIEETQRQLQALAAAGNELGEDQFILSEGAAAKPLMQYAVNRRLGTGYFRKILKKLGQAETSASRQSVIEPLESPWPQMEIFALGESRVLRDGKVIEKSAWQTAKTKELFFYLALDRAGGRKEHVTATLWPQLSRSQANDTFHTSKHRIKRALFDDCLILQDGLYLLNPEAPRWLDVEEFERLLRAADEADEEAESAELRARALDLYRGDLLQDIYSDWCQLYRDALREKYLGAVSQLGEYHTASGDFTRAIEIYQSGLARDHLREEIYRGLMDLYARMGDRTSAIKIYKRCEELLSNELHVTPMPETSALYERIAALK